MPVSAVIQRVTSAAVSTGFSKGKRWALLRHMARRQPLADAGGLAELHRARLPARQHRRVEQHHAGRKVGPARRREAVRMGEHEIYVGTPLGEFDERPSKRVGPCLGRPGAAARVGTVKRFSRPGA